MPLDITSLVNATTRLREALARHKSEPLDDQLQERAPSSEEVARMSFAELIRAGTAQGLLRAEWSVWRHFRDIRTRTTHIYDADTAAAVVAEIPSFLGEVEYLCAQLRQRPE